MWQRWPVGPRESKGYTSALRDDSGVPSRVGGRWIPAAQSRGTQERLATAEQAGDATPYATCCPPTSGTPTWFATLRDSGGASGRRPWSSGGGRDGISEEGEQVRWGAAAVGLVLVAGQHASDVAAWGLSLWSLPQSRPGWVRRSAGDGAKGPRVYDLEIRPLKEPGKGYWPQRPRGVGIICSIWSGAGSLEDRPRERSGPVRKWDGASWLRCCGTLRGSMPANL